MNEGVFVTVDWPQAIPAKPLAPESSKATGRVVAATKGCTKA